MFRFLKDCGLMVVILLVLCFLAGGGQALADPPAVVADPPPVLVSMTVKAAPQPVFPVLRQMVCDGLSCRLVSSAPTATASVTTSAHPTATSSTALTACESCGGAGMTAQTVSYQQMATATTSTVASAGGFHPIRNLFSAFANRPRLFSRGCGCGQ